MIEAQGIRKGTAAAAVALRQDLQMLARAAGVLALLAAAAAQMNWSGMGSARGQPPLRLASVVVQSAAEPEKIGARIAPQKPFAAPALEAAAAPAAEEHTASAGGLVTESFGKVEIVDAQTLKSGSLVVTLAGARLPARDSQCRRLDGRTEPCWERAKTQLELATRFKSVTCSYERAGQAAVSGVCRAGGQDLAKAVSRLTRV